MTVEGGDWAVLADPNSYDPNDLIWAEAFTYDGLGRPLTAAKVVDGNDVSGSVFVYNALGLLDSEQQTLFGGTPRTVGYGYDPYGYRTSITYPDGTTEITRTNTWAGQIDSLGRGQAELAAYAYQGGRMAERTYPTTAPVTAEYHYDNLGRLTGIDAGAGRVKFGYTYWDNENNIWQKTFDHRDGSPYNDYTYDDIDRLTAAAYHNSDTEGFVMDDLGNRDGNQTLRQEGTIHFTPDPLTNRYTAIAGHPLSYDDAGNLTQDKDGYQFDYDYENRITAIKNASDAVIATMDYDTLGRRIKVRDEIADKTTHYYYSDQWQVLSTYIGSTLDKSFVYGNYIDEVLVMNDGTDDYYYLHDHLYSPVALLNASGSVIERYEYDAYGKMQVLTPAFVPLSFSQYANAYYFTGREVDWFDNGNLILQYNRRRPYSQYMGCWFTPDPWGCVDGLNLYQYVNSNPLSGFDFYGLYTIMRGSDDQPDNAYRQTVIARSLWPIGDYGALYNNKDFRDNYAYYLMIMDDIDKRARRTHSEWSGLYPLSAKLLQVYMSDRNSVGSQMVGNFDVGSHMHIENIDYKSLLNDDPLAFWRFSIDVINVARYIEKNMALAHGSSIRTRSSYNRRDRKSVV